MSILNAFDPKSSPLFTPEAIYGKVKHIADICIVSFSCHVRDMFLQNYEYEIAGQVGTANGPIDVYLFSHCGKKILFYMSPIGSASAGALIHEVHQVTGATKFVVFGSCGVLDNGACSGKLIIPSECKRDEGLSYHYVEPSDYILMKNHKKLESIFKENSFPYVVGRDWTTDAIYMETKNKIAQRKEEGCISVEMEASALQAVSSFYGYELYQFFFPADLLDGDNWDKANLGGVLEKNIQRETFNVALVVANSI